MTDICRREGVKRSCVTLHSDNGSPMKGATLLATLHTLGVMPSFSRPSVSNDNPYSESLFGTLSERMTAQLVCDALQMALWPCHKPRNVIVHSDRGSQYAQPFTRRCSPGTACYAA